MSITTTDFSVQHHQLSSTMCSQCSSMAHFACLNHCNDVFCGKCSIKHRANITKKMNDLTQQLKQCRIDPVTTHDEIDAHFLSASQQTLRRTRDTVNNLIAEIQQREETIIKEIENGLEVRRKEREKRTNSALLTSEEAIDYTHLLDDCLKSDQLINAETITNIQHRLDARKALGQSTSEAKNPIVELGKFDIEEILRFRLAPRTELSPTINRSTSASRNITAVTVRLGKRKIFQSPLECAFSIGRHPIIISLNGHYCETFMCRRSDNSLILSKTTAIDVINRGSGLEKSIRISRILGTTKDKILAGTWCEHSQRLVLNGNHRMYFFCMHAQQNADQFLCEPAEGDIYNTSRFLGCTRDGSLIYAYKSGSNTYTIQRLAHPILPHPPYEPFHPKKSLLNLSGQDGHINGYVAGMCVTHNRVALIYRRLQPNKDSNHYFCLFDHNFNKPNGDDVLLPSYTRWITGITSFGNDGQYLLCDPRGQQLLLYRVIDGVLTRRFRIGAINACCLTDGKLVLWLQKQYASSPSGKLHFITPPHLEESADVAKSFPLLRKSNMN